MSVSEQDLRDLMRPDTNLRIEEINMEEAIVPGFNESIRLLPHQVIGRRWIAQRENVHLKRHGGILADDMGLGKTIQILTRILDGRPSNADRKAGWAVATLIICPLSLIDQWEQEIRSTCSDNLNIVQYFRYNRSAVSDILAKSDIVLTTYDILKSEYALHSASSTRNKVKPHLSSVLFHIDWFRVVLDEAHLIKNFQTKGAIAACELKAKFRWCLTGTPLQNDINELYSLLKFLRMKPLSDLRIFNEQFSRPVRSQMKSPNYGNLPIQRLQVVLTQIMLRRTKDCMLNGEPLVKLPPRNVNIVLCNFSSSERSLYDTLEIKIKETLGELGKRGQLEYTSVLVLLLRLRQACNHPILVSKDFCEDSKAIGDEDLGRAIEQLALTNKCHVCNAPLFSNEGPGQCVVCKSADCDLLKSGQFPSAKIRMLIAILMGIQARSGGREKTIIFSQFTSMLDLIEPFILHAGFAFVRYDGSLTSDARARSIDIIKKDSNVRCILISLKAGSTGLNLTACNNVILLDLWWNPGVEDQAFDRVHRLGQERAVNIYKLMIKNTVEEKIIKLQKKKRALTSSALSGDRISGRRMGMDELLALFKKNEKNQAGSGVEKHWPYTTIKGLPK